MTAPIVEVCDDVVEMINDASLLDTGIEAERTYKPLTNLKELTGQRCIVYPASKLSETRLTRGLMDHEYEIQVLVQEKLDYPTQEEIDDRVDTLLELVDSVADLFRDGVHIDASLAHCTDVNIDPIFYPPHLHDNNVFTSVINLVFMQARDIP